MFTHIGVKNYKSLKDVGLEAGRFMVLVGANAAGKSNFVDSLDFLKRCLSDGLTAAVGAKGGYENISFRRARRSRGGLEFNLSFDLRPPSKHYFTQARCQYQFAFRARHQAIAAEYEVTDEILAVDWISHDTQPGRIRIDRKAQSVKMVPNPPVGSPNQYLRNNLLTDLAPDELILSSRPGFWGLLRLMADAFSQIGVYQISPQGARQPGDPSGRKELGRTGTNLPAVLQYLQRADKAAIAELLAHLQKASSAFTGIETDYVETKQLGLFLREQGVGRRWYAHDLSDGTLQTLAIFVPLLDTRFSVVAIEEPENSLHPWVLRDFIETCRAQSNKKQIIVTTHSPVLVSHLKPNELFLVDRKAGATRIFPAMSVDQSIGEVINKGIMNLGDYWYSGQMSAVPGGPPLDELASEERGGI